MIISANSEAGDAHLRSVFISSPLYHPSVMVSSTSCFLETMIFSWFTNTSYTCVCVCGGESYGWKFKDPNMCNHASPKIDRHICCFDPLGSWLGWTNPPKHCGSLWTIRLWQLQGLHDQVVLSLASPNASVVLLQHHEEAPSVGSKQIMAYIIHGNLMYSCIDWLCKMGSCKKKHSSKLPALVLC